MSQSLITTASVQSALSVPTDVVKTQKQKQKASRSVSLLEQSPLSTDHWHSGHRQRFAGSLSLQCEAQLIRLGGGFVNFSMSILIHPRAECMWTFHSTAQSPFQCWDNGQACIYWGATSEGVISQNFREGETLLSQVHMQQEMVDAHGASIM